ncbi:MAG: hypothetical protein CVV42_05910 [Candidatus Riflebacteria bacterium HGW-Riflebacteria-2]|nr:MAG: hypothetical protein CVV42_05910 [Candidatus Riflebacteria bacterium HGW-Riflebacteria-2]
MRKTIVTVLMVLMFASLCAAQPAKFVDDNAALRYLMAMGYMPQISSKTADKLADVRDLESFKKLTKDNLKELNSASGFLYTVTRLLDLAADCSECTFIVDKNLDFDTIVPPYRSIRLFARYINAQGWQDAENEAYVEAARKFCHVFRLGLNVSSDGFAINGSFGIAIQKMAVESINNLLALNSDEKVKKILADCFANLPKPIVDSKVHIGYERVFIANSLIRAEKDPTMFGHMELFKDESRKPEPKIVAPDKACAANQRVLMGALEMYFMDNEFAPLSSDSETVIKMLVDQKYLKTGPVCENKGKYIFTLAEGEEYYDVSCSCGADPEKQSASIGETKEKEPEFSPEVMKKIDEYIKSEAYVEDKKEINVIFDEMLKIDPYTTTGDEAAGKLAERIESNKSTLVQYLMMNPQSFYKTLRENQQRIDDLVKKLSQ